MLGLLKLIFECIFEYILSPTADIFSIIQNANSIEFGHSRNGKCQITFTRECGNTVEKISIEVTAKYAEELAKSLIDRGYSLPQKETQYYTHSSTNDYILYVKSNVNEYHFMEDDSIDEYDLVLEVNDEYDSVLEVDDEYYITLDIY